MTRELEHLKCLLADEKSRIKSGSHVQSVRECLESLMFFSKDKSCSSRIKSTPILTGPNCLNVKRKVLLTVPGIGVTTANGLLAEIPDITKFKTAKQLVARFAGLVPLEQSSGSLHNKPRMSKVGQLQASQTAIYARSVSAKRYNPVIIALCARIESTGKSKMVAIGASMRKLVHIIFGVLKSGKPFNKRLHML